MTGPDVSESFRARLRDNDAADPWRDGFGIVQLAEQRLIGLCSYVGPPESEGIVEIAYFIAPDFEDQGYATEATNCYRPCARERPGAPVARPHHAGGERFNADSKEM